MATTPGICAGCGRRISQKKSRCNSCLARINRAAKTKRLDRLAAVRERLFERTTQRQHRFADLGRPLEFPDMGDVLEPGVDIPDGDDSGTIPPTDFLPTDATPGTEEKIEILESRRRAGLPLWHPDDLRGYGNLR